MSCLWGKFWFTYAGRPGLIHPVHARNPLLYFGRNGKVGVFHVVGEQRAISTRPIDGGERDKDSKKRPGVDQGSVIAFRKSVGRTCDEVRAGRDL